MTPSSPPVPAVLAVVLAVLALVLHGVGTASASICKADVCTREQYCCGDGQCCDNVYSIWYLCGGVAVTLFVVGSFCPAVRRCCCCRTPASVKYVPVPTSPDPRTKCPDRDKCTAARVDVTLPAPPRATTLDVTNCV